MKAKIFTALLFFLATAWLYQGKNPCKSLKYRMEQYQKLAQELASSPVLPEEPLLWMAYKNVAKHCSPWTQNLINTCASDERQIQGAEHLCRELKTLLEEQLVSHLWKKDALSSLPDDREEAWVSAKKVRKNEHLAYLLRNK